ncbi:helicase [Streptococcus phage STP2]|nr:helicase [Streptococcus phage STP2]
MGIQNKKRKTGLGTTNEHVYKFKTQKNKRMML